MKRGNSSSSEEEVDRISNLPDSLIQHILSFMDTKYAVQTCVLSTRWRYIWISMPVLNFSDIFHRDNQDSDESDTEDSDESDDEEVHAGKWFIKFVHKVLSLRDKSEIQRFHLDCSGLFYRNNDRLCRCIDRCIATAVSHNVQELCIRAITDEDFEFPLCLCTCKSLIKMDLELSGYYDSNIILLYEMSLPRLKALRLRLGEISFTDENLTNRFLLSFPSLESLIMEIRYRAFQNTNLRISLLKLEYFKFESCYDENTGEVKLHAPSLLSFVFDSYMSTSFTLENLSSLVTADIQIHVQSEDQVAGNSSEILSEKK